MSDADIQNKEESSHEEDSRDDKAIGQPPKKIIHHYSSSQKKHVVTMAKKKSIQTASDHSHIPRMMINRWMVNGYFDCNCTFKKEPERPRKTIDLWQSY